MISKTWTSSQFSRNEQLQLFGANFVLTTNNKLCWVFLQIITFVKFIYILNQWLTKIIKKYNTIQYIIHEEKNNRKLRTHWGHRIGYVRHRLQGYTHADQLVVRSQGHSYPQVSRKSQTRRMHSQLNQNPRDNIKKSIHHQIHRNAKNS